MGQEGSANDRQIGGDHYKGEYQHWDFVVDTGQGYLDGCVTKYVSRWRKKNGVQDLEKALHYFEKAKEIEPHHPSVLYLEKKLIKKPSLLRFFSKKK